MADGIPTVITPVTLGTGDTTLFTVGAGFTYILTELDIVNLDTVDGMAVGIKRKLADLSEFTVRVYGPGVNDVIAGDTEQWTGSMMFDESEVLEGWAESSTAIDVHAHVVKVAKT